MPPIRARNPTGAEFSFLTREDFARAASSGRIAPDWEVFHARARRWLPVTVHPAFAGESSPVAPRGRSSDLVLIYPDFVPPSDPAGAHAPQSDPFDSGPILAADEIQRVLHPVRVSDPHATAAEVGDDSVVPEHPARPLLERALRTVPTFSKALMIAAGLVNTRLA
jgi:hypothetical protein